MLFSDSELYICASRTSIRYFSHYLFDNVPPELSSEYKRISDSCQSYSDECFERSTEDFYNFLDSFRS